QALPQLAAAPNDIAPRYALCAATLLQNREADDGGGLIDRLWVARVAYALSTALIANCPHVSQGEGYSVLMGTVARRVGERDPEAMLRIARALGIDDTGLTAAVAAQRIADKLDATLRSIGMPTRLSEVNIDRAVFPRLIEH